MRGNSATNESLLPSRWGRYRLPLFLGLAFLVVNGLVRIGLTLANRHLIDAGPVDLLGILGVGALFDLQVAVCATTPTVLYLTIVPGRLFATRLHRFLTSALVFLALALLLFQAGAEWVFWAEFQVRFNFVAVDYLAYTHEVIGNIVESYPIFWISAAIALGSLALTWRYSKSTWATQSQTCRMPFRRRALWATGWSLLCFLAVLLITNFKGPRFSNNYNVELSRNGTLSFIAAFWSNEIDYEAFYVTLSDEEAFQRIRRIVGCDVPESTSTIPENIIRRIHQQGTEQRLNVIQITVESLSSRYMGLFGNPLQLTPELDAIAARSLFFSRCYATGTRTVRGMEALALSVPPTPGRSIVKRPHNEGLFSIGKVLRDHDYDSVFLYGGHGFFDNMNYFFENNGFRVVDRAMKPDSAETFGTVWGACDEDLYDWTLAEADSAHAQGRPFFHFVMTTSNHRPYRFPAGRIENEQGRRSSAVRYTDFAIGRFLTAAAKKPWFDHTIFVIVADHCASSAGRSGLPVENYEIPLIFFAPAHLQPQRIETICSQIDVAPTILSLLNLSYESEFYGRDILSMLPTEGRALIGNHQKLGLLTHESLVTLEPQRVVHNYRVHEDRSLTEVAVDADSRDDAIAFYQTAFLRFQAHRRTLE